MKKGLWLSSSLLTMLLIIASGCAKETPEPPSPAPAPGILPAEHQRDFPENLRWLTDKEKDRLIEIALNIPKAREWLEKEPEYTASIGWIALTPSSEGEGYSGYRYFEYEIVSKGIPRGIVDITPEGSPERVVSVGVPEEAEIYPCVHIHFGKPVVWIVMAAIDLEAERVKYTEEYPARTWPPLQPKDAN
jgi:hypothetical protein